MTSRQILEACRSDEPRWYSLDSTWVTGDYIAATNGHIIARLPKDKCDWLDFVGQPKNPPPIGNLGWDEPRLDTVALPDVEPAPEGDECPKCLGSGHCMCKCGDEHDCSECDGEGEVEPIERLVAVGPLWLAARYIRLLKKFGVESVLPDKKDPATRPVSWHIGDVEGLLMPCNAP